MTRVFFRSIVLFFFWLISFKGMAFTCNPGLNINGKKVISVDVDANFFENLRAKGQAQLFDLSKSVTCSGQVGPTFKDAVRIVKGSAKLSPLLVDIGAEGYVTYFNSSEHPFSAIPLHCVWPDRDCTYTTTDREKRGPMGLIVGLKILSYEQMKPLAISAGTEITKLRLLQRGLYATGINWGPNYYDISVITRNDIVVPSRTCTVNDENVVVNMPTVNSLDLKINGAGRYPQATKFSLNLACDPGARVDVRFDATPMGNHTDVIANSAGTAEGVGIQVMDKAGSSVVLGDEVRVITSAEPHETLNYDAFYYYDGGALSPGTVKGLATVVFDYM